MLKIDDMRISTKTMAAFGIVLATTTGLGLMAIQGLTKVNQSAEMLRSNSLPVTRVLGEIAYNAIRARQLEASVALASDPALSASEQDMLRQTQAQVRAGFATYQPFVDSDDEHRLADQMKQDWAAYLELDTKFLVRAQINPAAASAFYTGDMRTSFNKFQDDLQADIAMNMKQANEEADNGAALGKSVSLWISVLLGVSALLCITIGFLMIRGVSVPLAAMTLAMQRLAGGDTEVVIPFVGRGDEVGAMADSVQVFKANMIETERLRAGQEEQKQRAAAERRSAMLDLAAKFEASVGGVVGNVSSQATELQATAQSMAATSEETSRQSSTVAAASEQATSNVGMVASATEELSASVGEILQRVNASNQMIGEAVTETTSANQQMQGLSESVRKIGEVVSLINSIASQTNLLALNATIEAARAGDVGKGFAVVASEVKALATQTAKATEVISSQISAIQEVTQISVQSIQHINTRIGHVADTAIAIAAAVEQQGAATREIARNVTEAARGTSEVSMNIGGVNEAAQQTGAAASQVLSSAGELSKNSEILKSQVMAFLAEVRAA